MQFIKIMAELRGIRLPHPLNWAHRHHIDLPLLQHLQRNIDLGNKLVHDAVDLRRRSPVFFVAHQHNFLAGIPLLEFIRARTYGKTVIFMGIEIGAVIEYMLRHDRDGAADFKRPEVWTRIPELDGIPVDLLDAFHIDIIHLERGARHLRIAYHSIRIHHIVGGKLDAVAPEHAFFQSETVAHPVGRNAPRFGKLRKQFQRIVIPVEERFVHVFVDSRRNRLV